MQGTVKSESTFFFFYRASNFVLENLSTYAGDDADGNYDGDANCDYDQGYEC